MTRILLIIITALGLVIGALTLDRAKLVKRTRRAEDALLLADQAKTELAANLAASESAREALQKERNDLSARIDQAGQEAGRIRREGEARVQRLLMAPAPSDPSALAGWAASQAQDLNQRLEAP